MMNTKIDIEDLLKNLPTEKTGEGFTAQLMSVIAGLPVPQRKRLSKPLIICIGTVILGLIVGAWWITDYFFDWTQVYVQPVLKNIAEIFNSMFSTISQIKFSPLVIEGLLAGAFLLLIDAVVRRRVVKN